MDLAQFYGYNAGKYGDSFYETSNNYNTWFGSKHNIDSFSIWYSGSPIKDATIYFFRDTASSSTIAQGATIISLIDSKTNVGVGFRVVIPVF